VRRVVELIYTESTRGKGAVVGRKDSSITRMLDLLDRIQPHLRHVPDVTHTEIEELRSVLREVQA
jgi:hypothetical protein